MCISANLKAQPTLLSSSLAPFIRRTLDSQDGHGLIYRPTESEGPESQRGQASWYKLNLIFWNSKGEATHLQCFIHSIDDSLPPSFFPFIFSPFLPFFQILILWAGAYLCGCILQTKNEKHNKGKGKVRLDKMQQLSAFLTDDTCSPRSLTVHRNSCVFLNKSSSMCKSVAI